MGDRAYVEIVCQEEDEPLFEALGFLQEFRHALPANVVTMVDAEASEGVTTELQALAEKGIVDPAEIAHFTALAEEWWDHKGKFAQLHRMNPVRLAFIKEIVTRLNLPE